MIEERRWRRIGRVRSRPLAGTGREALLRADALRTLRARGPLVPLVTATVWTMAVLPAMLPLHPVSAVLIPLGAVLVVYRLANRPPVTYGGALFDSPFAAFPVDLIRQLLRGPALLAVLTAVHVLLAA